MSVRVAQCCFLYQTFKFHHIANLYFLKPDTSLVGKIKTYSSGGKKQKTNLNLGDFGNIFGELLAYKPEKPFRFVVE